MCEFFHGICILRLVFVVFLELSLAVLGWVCGVHQYQEQDGCGTLILAPLIFVGIFERVVDEDVPCRAGSDTVFAELSNAKWPCYRLSSTRCSSL